MPMFVWALGAFILLHIGVSASGMRGRIIARIGEGAYRGLFALASIAVFVWMIFAFNQMRADPYEPLNSELFAPPSWGRYVAQVQVLLGFVLGVTGLLTPGPTTAGMEGALAKENPARGVLRITRHPFLWGIALWSLGHLFANGERFAIMLFGGLGLMVLLGTRSIDRKSSARNPEGWQRFAAVTSNIPFAAIVQGRNKLVLSELAWRPFVALALYGVAAWAHGALGRPVFP